MDSEHRVCPLAPNGSGWWYFRLWGEVRFSGEMGVVLLIQSKSSLFKYTTESNCYQLLCIRSGR